MSDLIFPRRPRVTSVFGREGDVVLTADELAALLAAGANITITTVGNMLKISAPGYEHAQGTAATTWIVNHNLGYRPDVSVRNSGGSIIDVEVLHTSVNQCQILLSVSTAGSARCS